MFPFRDPENCDADSRAEDLRTAEYVSSREHWAKALDLPPYLISERDEPSNLFETPTNEEKI